MLSLGGERLPPTKKKKKVLDHYLHHGLGMLPLLWCFFAHLLILEYPDHHQNLISSSLYYPGPLHKISFQSVHNFLSNVVHRQTNRQTDKLTNATKNITSFAKEVIIKYKSNKNKIDRDRISVYNYMFFKPEKPLSLVLDGIRTHDLLIFGQTPNYGTPSPTNPQAFQILNLV